MGAKTNTIKTLDVLREKLNTVYDEDYALEVYEDLSKMDIHLDEDPLEFGPLRLNGKIANCRTYQQDCQKYEIELSRLTSLLRSLKRQVEIDYDLQKSHLLMHDEQVRKGASIKERELYADRKLIKERRVLGDIERALEETGMVLKVVKAKKADLKDAGARIRDQYKICQEAIACEGARWRNKKAPKVDLNPNESQATVQVGSSMEQFLDPIVAAVANANSNSADDEDDEAEEDFVVVEPVKNPTNSTNSTNSTKRPELSVVKMSDDDIDGFLDDLLEDEDDSVTQKFDLSRSVVDLSAVHF